MESESRADPSKTSGFEAWDWEIFLPKIQPSSLREVGRGPERNYVRSP